MTKNEPFAAVAAAEELVAAACAAVAEWVPDCERELSALAEEHLRVAVRFAAKPRRWLKQRMAINAMLATAVGTRLGVLGWLRTQEQRLVEAYVAIEASPALDVDDRQELRRALVPAAFERFSRVDQLIMTREEEGVYA
jgi:hypothetical protein